MCHGRALIWLRYRRTCSWPAATLPHSPPPRPPTLAGKEGMGPGGWLGVVGGGDEDAGVVEGDGKVEDDEGHRDADGGEREGEPEELNAGRGGQKGEGG